MLRLSPPSNFYRKPQAIAPYLPISQVRLEGASGDNQPAEAGRRHKTSKRELVFASRPNENTASWQEKINFDSN
ncbi:MAG: hypothetical protein IGS49_03020 [Chlorogloeopsis fritschii C42_A2020_084]|uniref:hypothetical protein n=1 Tax=Chlorogloeopsis fritschii TaxID=1124 RepID=UPI0019D8D7D9|nr:hypothetical protein [Chlorogloeopsis fritschii]MBF2004459.1 hypothetical protein [Chlorogloeopsis fritschii C42_A2020_084]